MKVERIIEPEEWVVEHQKIEAELVVRNNVIPRTCDICWFNIIPDLCTLVNVSITKYIPICTVYDHTKYILEVL